MIGHVVENRGSILKYWERTHNSRIQLVEDENSNFAEFRVFHTGSGEEINTQAHTH